MTVKLTDKARIRVSQKSKKISGYSKAKMITQGENLIDQIVTLTGLPESWVTKEIDQILKISGFTNQQITIESLRSALLLYLDSLNDEIILQSPVSHKKSPNSDLH